MSDLVKKVERAIFIHASQGTAAKAAIATVLNELKADIRDNEPKIISPAERYVRAFADEHGIDLDP